MLLMSRANVRTLRVLVITTLTFVAATSALGENKAFSVAQQNALVHKYCAVCHTDASRNGGLSLEHYDAGTPDPALAAMLLSKLRNGAMSAAGLGIPDKATGDAWIAATTAQAEGANQWSVILRDEAG
jgi:mono/diheme cytochrome c family protein